MNITKSDSQKIRQVIEQQIVAFWQNDAVLAFSQAAPGIQIQFGTAENFVRTVQAAYPPVYHPRSVMFEALMMVEGLPAQQVMLMDSNGQLIRATYTMQRQQSGHWKIAGCYLTPVE